MAPPVRTNDQILPRIRWVQTGYLKFSAKGTKREVFGMPIPGSLITADFQEASYYQEYLAHVVKHRWFLAGEPARKPNQQNKKFRSTSFRKTKKEKSENKGRVPTEMELELELTQQGSSYEVSKHLLFSDIEDSVIDPVTHKSNPPNHSRSLNGLLFHFSRSFTCFYRLSHSELAEIEKVAVCSSLQSLRSHGVLRKYFGTVPVRRGVQEKCREGNGVLAGNSVTG
nr:hypothetical protein [Tanacetum cinerariifolium]